MKNTYKMICENQDQSDITRDVLESLNDTTDFDVGSQASELNGTEFQQVASWIADAVRKRSVMHSMVLAAMIYLFMRAAEYGTRGECIDEFSEEVGIARTQLYDSARAYRVFGRDLLSDGTRASNFVMASVTLLSRKEVAEAARKEAIALADSGTKVTINVAKALIRKHRSTVDGPEESCRTDTSRQTVAPRAVKQAACEARAQAYKPNVLWRYSDALVRVVLEPASPGKPVNIEAMTFALEAALKKIRGEFERLDVSHGATNSTEEEYVDVE